MRIRANSSILVGLLTFTVFSWIRAGELPEPFKLSAALPPFENTTWSQSLESIENAGAPPQWLLLGPSASDRSDLKNIAEYEPDQQADWSKKLKDAKGQPFDRHILERGPDDDPIFVNIGDGSVSAETVGYALARIECPTDFSVNVLFEASGYSSLHVNGEAIFAGMIQTKTPGRGSMSRTASTSSAGRTLLRFASHNSAESLRLRRIRPALVQACFPHSRDAGHLRRSRCRHAA